MVNFRDNIGLLSVGSSRDVSLAGGIWAINAHPNNVAGVDNVAQKVLESFDIPIYGSIPEGSKTGLPGYDINDQDALSMLKLGLASYLAEGQLVDININGDGFAEFIIVAEQGGSSPNTPILLSIRSCIPTFNFEEKASAVIVSGYDAPPEREIMPGKSLIPQSKAEAGELTSLQDVSSSDCMILCDAFVYGDTADRKSCVNTTFETSAIITYKDPVLDAPYDSQEAHAGRAFYDIKAFENLVGYIIDFDTGHDELHISYQTSSTTTHKYAVAMPTLSTGGERVCAILENGGGAEYATFKTGKINVEAVTSTDRYGDDSRSIFLGIQSLEAVGHTIENFQWSSWVYSDTLWLYIDDRKLRLSIPQGKNWNWAYGTEGGAEINVYSPYGSSDGLSDDLYDALSYASHNTHIMPYRNTDFWNPGVSQIPSSSPYFINPVVWPYVGSGVGTLVDKLVVSASLERPCVIVSDPYGEAIQHARDLQVTYYPVIMRNTPAPVAYVVEGEGSGLVDQSLDIYDVDPSTVQTEVALQKPSMAWLQTKKIGNTLEISLPFLEEDECLIVAEFLFDIFDNFGSTSINTYNLVCGPDDEPILGHTVDGFDEHLRINEISYSYQDGSSYNINVALGPVVMNIGSWNTSIWQKKVEDVSRTGKVIFSSGDGISYRIRVHGLGDYYALNASDTGNYVVGEEVTVRIYNNPVEK